MLWWVEASYSRVVILVCAVVTVVQGADPWGVRCTTTQICAVKGSKVQIRCSYWHPSTIDGHDVAVEKTFWFTKVQDGEPVDLRSASEYTGRVKYDCGNQACTLTITDLRDSDSDLYQFRFTTNQPTGSLTGSTGVSLSVTGVQVLSTKSSSCRTGYCSWSHVECQTSCSPTPSPSYIWYKNGQKTSGGKSYSDYFYSADSISCAVRGHEDFPSAPVCVDGNSCNRVNYINRNICAFKGSSVDISCSYNSHFYSMTKSWFVAEREDVQLYRPQAVDLLKDPEFTARVQVLDSWRGRSTLRIKNLRLRDSAQYRFTFKSQWFEWDRSFPGTTLTVTDPDVQVICSPIGPTLTCHSSCLLSGRPSFVWYKNGTEIHGETSPTFRGFLQPENNYSCAYEHHHSSPVYAPKVPLVQLSQPGDILKDSSVSLTCSSDANPPPAYTWYKENQALLNRAAQLVFRSIPLSDSGEYYCTAENELGKTLSKRVLINVKYAPQPPSVSVSPSGEIMEGSSVTLTCSSDANPAANYTWYKRSGDKQVQPKASGQNFTITDITAEHGGKYQCEAQNTHGRSNTTLYLTVADGAWKSAVTGTTTALLLVVILLTVFLWIRRNKSFTQQRECGERPEDRAQIPAAAHTRPAEQHHDVHYASVCFTQNRADDLYSNIGRVQPQRGTEEEEEEAEYSAVRFDRATGTRREEEGDDSSAVYSTVTKH
ncbi:B-cell receptor CD22-like isoform X4 [Platichthys flesus]|uniref:B-cell receptor CD22-like isoform X4 n=1 Tax=Platichthys flesus TaxID=8260 RepID=UPI002DB87593|nr:B-cell receptor CD22-like isoform X4 [Platichthys flesus]